MKLHTHVKNLVLFLNTRMNDTFFKESLHDLFSHCFKYLLLHHSKLAYLVVFPGMCVFVQLYHVLELGPKLAPTEDGVGNIPVNVNRFHPPTLCYHFKEKK